MEDIGYFNKICLYTHLGGDSSSPVIRIFSSSWYHKGIFLGGNLCLAFRQKGGRAENLSCICSSSIAS